MSKKITNVLNQATQPRIIIEDAQGLKIVLQYHTGKSVELDTDGILLAMNDSNIKIGFQAVPAVKSQPEMSPLEFALGKNAPCNCKGKCNGKKRG